MSATSPYEQHVSMIINCMSKCAFAVIAIGLIETILYLAMASADRVKPVCVFSLLFNLFFGSLAILLVKQVLPFLRQLAFAETYAEKLLAPKTNGVVVIPEMNAAIKFSVFDDDECSNFDGIVKMIIALRQDKKDAIPANNNTVTAIISEPSSDDNNNDTTTTTTTQPPSTPSSECSQADTTTDEIIICNKA